ncbi:hypothetical protein BDY19DRAFT_273397 [Irpex rosettiformis]|uniref:Uncharacterized protein n=1 Tax=Irpex rosettiformis TaxID=378272 RepID=A0ACB8UI71_9APHY|nr:hypothetical protein BDY19DRAFT_273397 [Irpex rosettiformis]
MLIASHAAEDNVVLLTTLECVHTCNLNFLVEVLLQSAVELHVVDDVRPLPLIRCDDTNLAWYNARLEKLGYDLLDVRRLRPNTHVPSMLTTELNLTKNTALTYSGKKCRLTRFPPALDSDRRTWGCQGPATGSRRSCGDAPEQSLRFAVCLRRTCWMGTLTNTDACDTGLGVG